MRRYAVYAVTAAGVILLLLAMAPIAAAQTSPQVKLAWDSVTGATGYHIYRNCSGSNLSDSNKITPAPVAQGTQAAPFVDAGIPKGQTCYYAVTAVDANGGESSYSNVVKVLILNIPSSPPINVKISFN